MSILSKAFEAIVVSAATAAAPKVYKAVKEHGPVVAQAVTKGAKAVKAKIFKK